MADNEDLELDELTADEAGNAEAGEEAAAAAETEGEEGAETASASEAVGDDSEISRTAADLEAVFDIPVHVSAVLGKSRMQVSQLLKLGRGAVVELDRKVGEAIDIYVNNRLVARGEVVVVEDRLGVTMTEIIKSDRR